MEQDKKLLVGKILGPHGIRGQVRIASYTDDPSSIFDYAPLTDEAGVTTYALTFKGVGKDHFIAAVKGVATREGAESLKGAKLYVSRGSLPEEAGQYYHADLVGLAVRDASGVAVGRVSAVHDYGAGAFLEILPPQGKSFMLPFKDAFVPVVDVAAGFLSVAIPDGWLAEEKEPAPKAKDKKAKDKKAKDRG